MEKKKVYAVATAHLDTVWRWNLATTIEEYIPDTIAKNLDLIENTLITGLILRVLFAMRL